LLSVRKLAIIEQKKKYSSGSAFQPVITKPAEKSMKMKVWGLDVIFGNQYGCQMIIRHGGLQIDDPC
jgi:hypothetical protein